jgi:hypothetical protein
MHRSCAPPIASKIVTWRCCWTAGRRVRWCCARHDERRRVWRRECLRERHRALIHRALRPSRRAVMSRCCAWRRRGLHRRDSRRLYYHGFCCRLDFPSPRPSPDSCADLFRFLRVALNASFNMK